MRTTLTMSPDMCILTRIVVYVHTYINVCTSGVTIIGTVGKLPVSFFQDFRFGFQLYENREGYFYLYMPGHTKLRKETIHGSDDRNIGTLTFLKNT